MTSVLAAKPSVAVTETGGSSSLGGNASVPTPSVATSSCLAASVSEAAASTTSSAELSQVNQVVSFPLMTPTTTTTNSHEAWSDSSVSNLSTTSSDVSFGALTTSLAFESTNFLLSGSQLSALRKSPQPLPQQLPLLLLGVAVVCPRWDLHSRGGVVVAVCPRWDLHSRGVVVCPRSVLHSRTRQGPCS